MRFSLTAWAAGLAALSAHSSLAAPSMMATQHSLQEREEAAQTQGGIKPSFDVSSCPGYKLAGEPRMSKSGFEASLELAGQPCNAFGVDIHNLTLAVVYEKPEQLHVHVYDTAKQQYQLPNGLLFNRTDDNPDQDGLSSADDSHLEFHHTGNDSPWAFWVTRKSTGDILFDTRAARIPTYSQGLNATYESRHNSTAMPAHPMIFENQYIQLSSTMPEDANIWGLGEYVSEFKRNASETLQPFFPLDAGDPLNSNMYGYWPVYLEARESDQGLQSHMVYWQSTAGMDVLLRPKVIQYRAIGGTMDLRFFSGDKSSDDGDSDSQSTQSGGSNSTDSDDMSRRAEPDFGQNLESRDDGDSDDDDDSTQNSPLTAMEQFVQFVGLPTMAPRWAFGFHLCRWGYRTANQTLDIAKQMRKHNIPLETMWNDIDIMDSFRDFTIAPGRFDKSDTDALINYLTENQQHYIPIVDAAIPAAPTNDSDSYLPGTVGQELDVFVKNPNGTIYTGQVWPGYAWFPAWTTDNAQQWWTDAFRNFTQLVNISGVWLDMNEPSSFCVGSCGSGQNLSTWFGHEAPANVGGWPEGYNNYTWGDGGNLTINGKSTYSPDADGLLHPPSRFQKRADGDDDDDHNNTHYSVPDWNYANETQRYLSVPPYSIHNGRRNYNPEHEDILNQKTVAMPALSGNTSMYDLHTFWGTLLEKATYNALTEVRPNERPFLISRSTYPGAGKYTHHWSGDNYSLWSYAYWSISAILQFQSYGIPFIGSDVAGFARNTDEELALRWHQLGAMIYPFYRNHNVEVALSQEPFRWDSVANATRKVNYKRLELLPYYYTVLARASQNGTPAIRTLWHEWPSMFKETQSTQSQLMFGSSLLVTPVLEPNASTVKGFFPSAGGKWRSVYDYEALDVEENKNVTIAAPLQTINVHLRPGRAILTHSQPGYTTAESADGPFGLLVNLNNKGKASGEAYLDDGITPPPLPSRELRFSASNGSLSGRVSSGDYEIQQKLANVVLMGVKSKPGKVSIDGSDAKFDFDDSKQLLNVTGLNADLSSGWKIEWS